jgi:C-terminal processing protease CtpA/Prc
MIRLEDRLERYFSRKLTKEVSHRKVAKMLDDFRDMATGQKISLNERLQTISDGAIIPKLDSSWVGNSSENVASTVLQAAYTNLNEAIIGYSTLSIVAKRFRDSPIIGEHNTTDIADLHMRNYVAAVRSINDLLHDVIIDELDHQGNSCDCTCACCGIGLCICATYNRETLNNAWTDVGSFADAGDLLVLQPRLESPAATAGITKGDYIVSADGKQLASYGTLYEIADGHQSGETIELKVRRASGELSDVNVAIP